MAIVVEDGTGITSADAYQSLVSFRAYHTKFGNTSVTGLDDPATELLILKATRYMDAVWGARLAGTRWKATQGLEGPRYPIYHRDGSGNLIDAAGQMVIFGNVCAELGLRAYTEDIYPDLANSGIVTAESASVGSISTSKTYATGISPIKKYRLAEDMMAPLLGGSLLNGELVRS